MILPNPLCLQRKMVLIPRESSDVLQCLAVPFDIRLLFCTEDNILQFPPLRLCEEAFFHICLKICGLKMHFPWPTDPRQCTSLLPSSLFSSSSHSQCYCPPRRPKTLQSARILTQPREKPCNFLLPSLFQILCKSCLSLPLISAPHLPHFIFQQVTAIMVIFASGIDCVHRLLTRLWLPFSACVYFSVLLHPFLSQLSSCQYFSVPQSI